MADLDFGKIKLYVGNYDFWFRIKSISSKIAITIKCEKEEQIKELQEFIARF